MCMLNMHIYVPTNLEIQSIWKYFSFFSNSGNLFPECIISRIYRTVEFQKKLIQYRKEISCTILRTVLEPFQNRSRTVLEPFQNRSRTDLEPIQNRLAKIDKCACSFMFFHQGTEHRRNTLFTFFLKFAWNIKEH